jgi:hypothetical protein
MLRFVSEHAWGAGYTLGDLLFMQQFQVVPGQENHFPNSHDGRPALLGAMFYWKTICKRSLAGRQHVQIFRVPREYGRRGMRVFRIDP